jgi:uncharacterized protein (TIGR02246 family)
MTRLGYGSLFAVLVAALAVCTNDAEAQNSPAKVDTSSAELQAVIEKYVAAYNMGAVEPVMAFWAENSDFVDIRGRFHEGRDLIAALFRRGFAANPGRKVEFKSAARKFLAPDVAMDDGVLHLTGADGEKHSGRYTVVWTKINGKWLIRSARDIPLPEEDAPAAPQTPPLDELAWLVGKWEAKSEKHTITLDCNWQLDKNFLVQTFHVKSADDDFQVVTYIAFDPAEGRFRSWFFDSRGGFGGGAWTRRDKVYKAAIVSVLPDGQVGSSVMTWELTDANTLSWQAFDREVNGETLPDSSQKYTRVK